MAVMPAQTSFATLLAPRLGLMLLLLLQKLNALRHHEKCLLRERLSFAVTHHGLHLALALAVTHRGLHHPWLALAVTHQALHLIALALAVTHHGLHLLALALVAVTHHGLHLCSLALGWDALAHANR